MRPFLRWSSFLIPSVVVLSLACGSGGQEEPEGTPTPVPTPQDHAAIRLVDFASLAETQELLQRLGSGEVVARDVLFDDLTGDMREEAIVPVTSDGSLGNIAYLVFTLDDDTPRAILTRTMDGTSASGLAMGVDDFGALTETTGVFGNEDPLCCPSELRLTTFRWDGDVMQVDGEMKTENPDAGKKD